jgi:hypothetical protein
LVFTATAGVATVANKIASLGGDVRRRRKLHAEQIAMSATERWYNSAMKLVDVELVRNRTSATVIYEVMLYGIAEVHPPCMPGIKGLASAAPL